LGETISVLGGRTQNARGSIAGSVISMLAAVRKMMELGVGEIDVARMASSNPARLLGISNECGSIEEGKRADLVALDRNGMVRLTLVAGWLPTPLTSEYFLQRRPSQPNRARREIPHPKAGSHQAGDDNHTLQQTAIKSLSRLPLYINPVTPRKEASKVTSQLDHAARPTINASRRCPLARNAEI